MRTHVRGLTSDMSAGRHGELTMYRNKCASDLNTILDADSDSLCGRAEVLARTIIDMRECLPIEGGVATTS